MMAMVIIFTLIKERMDSLLVYPITLPPTFLCTVSLSAPKEFQTTYIYTLPCHSHLCATVHQRMFLSLPSSSLPLQSQPNVTITSFKAFPEDLIVRGPPLFWGYLQLSPSWYHHIPLWLTCPLDHKLLEEVEACISTSRTKTGISQV